MAEALGLALANQRLRSALLEKALFDSLTGLRNRHHLDEACIRRWRWRSIPILR